MNQVQKSCNIEGSSSSNSNSLVSISELVTKRRPRHCVVTSTTAPGQQHPPRSVPRRRHPAGCGALPQSASTAPAARDTPCCAPRRPGFPEPSASHRSRKKALGFLYKVISNEECAECSQPRYPSTTRLWPLKR